MTDAWCHGIEGCGVTRLAEDVLHPCAHFMSERTLCPGCFARENPHATGPHTRIVEGWEHEYGALCRVVLSPLIVAADDGWPYGRDLLDALAALSGFMTQGIEAAAVVGGVPGTRHITPTSYGGVMPFPGMVPVLSQRGGVELAYLDAERLALKWSPPVDEEAA